MYSGLFSKWCTDALNDFPNLFFKNRIILSILLQQEVEKLQSIISWFAIEKPAHYHAIHFRDQNGAGYEL